MSDESPYEAEKKGPTEYPSEGDVSRYHALEAADWYLRAVEPFPGGIDLEDPNFEAIRRGIDTLEMTATCLKYATGEEVTDEELKRLNRLIVDRKEDGDI